MTKEFKEILSECIFETVVTLISEQEPFNLVVENYNNWSGPLPERLRDMERFVMQVKDQTLEDIELKENSFILTTDFDGEVVTKEFFKENVAGIFAEDMRSPIMIKYFRETPIYGANTHSKKYTVSPEEEARSMEALRQWNPHLFEQ